ncbi:MAG: hypothetical protein ACLR39_02670, partial [Oscillospiraceae bacterium]
MENFICQRSLPHTTIINYYNKSAGKGQAESAAAAGFLRGKGTGKRLQWTAGGRIMTASVWERGKSIMRPDGTRVKD